jgi:hypothetical protein
MASLPEPTPGSDRSANCTALSAAPAKPSSFEPQPGCKPKNCSSSGCCRVCGLSSRTFNHLLVAVVAAPSWITRAKAGANCSSGAFENNAYRSSAPLLCSTNTASSTPPCIASTVFFGSSGSSTALVPPHWRSSFSMVYSLLRYAENAIFQQ